MMLFVIISCLLLTSSVESAVVTTNPPRTTTVVEKSDSKAPAQNLVDESFCPFTYWESGHIEFRQAFLWNSCIKHNGAWATWDQAKQSCNEYDNGHLLILDSEEKKEIFNQTLTKWGRGTATNGWYFWILRSTHITNSPMYYYITGITEENKNKLSFFMCEYPAKTIVQDELTTKTPEEPVVVSQIPVYGAVAEFSSPLGDQAKTVFDGSPEEKMDSSEGDSKKDKKRKKEKDKNKNNEDKKKKKETDKNIQKKD